MHAPFDRVETWIFDLDNTLYPPHERLFAQIEARISAYVQRELGVDEAEAHRLRRAYWHDHGTTLAGLMIHHKVDPEPFLHEVHDIDFSALDPDPRLGAALAALPGRRIIYTNGARDYALGVLKALGIEDAFETVWGIEDAFYTPKPREAAFRRIFGKDGLNPRRAAFFEDDHRNLEAPHGMGVITALVRPEPGGLDAGPRSAADAPAAEAHLPPKAAAEIAEAAGMLAVAAPIRPPSPATPAHVDYLVRDLSAFLERLPDMRAPAPRRAPDEALG